MNALYFVGAYVVLDAIQRFFFQIVLDRFSNLASCMKKTFEMFLGDLCEKYHTRQIKSQKQLKAEFDIELENSIYPEFPPEYALDFRNFVTSNIKNTISQWDNLMQSQVSDFIAKEKGCSGAKLLQDFREFFYENSENPYIKRIEKYVCDNTLDFISEIIKNFTPKLVLKNY